MPGKGNRAGAPGGGKGRGRMGGFSAGPGGECVCPSCGVTAAHQAGIPCNHVKCPECGTIMQRKLNG